MLFFLQILSKITGFGCSTTHYRNFPHKNSELYASELKRGWSFEEGQNQGVDFLIFSNEF